MSTLDYLHGIEVLEINDAVKPVSTVRLSVIGLVGTAGKGPVNVPVLLIGSRTDAEVTFGKFRNDGFTIPEALDGIHDQIGATVVVVNVLDPEIHEIIGEERSVTLEPNQGQFGVGFIKSFTIANEVELATARITSEAVVVNLTGVTTVNADATVTVASTAGLLAGMKITGHASIPNGATVLSITDATHFELSANATNGTTETATATKDAAIFLPQGATNPTYFDFVFETPIASLNTLPVGEQVKVSYDINLVENTDYTLNKELGVVTRIGDASKVLPGGTLHFEVTRVKSDVALQTLNPLIIGEASDHSGLQALLSAKSFVHVTPRIIIAPRFTHQKPDAVTRNPVVAEIQQVCRKLRAIAYIDCDGTSKEAAVAHRNDFAEDERLVFLEPWIKAQIPGSGGTIITQPQSARWAGVTAFVDNTMGFYNSPSNKQINGVLGLSRPVSFELGEIDTEANYLNSNNICTLIYEQGLRTWGNTAASGRFINVRRVADMINESIKYWAITFQDRNITKGLIEDLLQGVNDYIGRLKAEGAILGGKAWIDKTRNTRPVIALGQLVIDFDFTAGTPLNKLTFRSHLVDDYFEEIFPNTTNVA